MNRQKKLQKFEFHCWTLLDALSSPFSLHPHPSATSSSAVPGRLGAWKMSRASRAAVLASPRVEAKLPSVIQRPGSVIPTLQVKDLILLEMVIQNQYLLR